MTSFIPSKTLGRLMLISAGFLLHANGALAADLVGDTQMRASDLLSGTASGRAKIVDVSALPGNGRNAFNSDPHEQARQLILGTPNVAGIASRAGFDSETKLTPAVSVGNIRPTYADGQESARRMLLGAQASPAK